MKATIVEEKPAKFLVKTEKFHAKTVQFHVKSQNLKAINSQIWLLDRYSLQLRKNGDRADPMDGQEEQTARCLADEVDVQVAGHRRGRGQFEVYEAVAQDEALHVEHLFVRLAAAAARVCVVVGHSPSQSIHGMGDDRLFAGGQHAARVHDPVGVSVARSVVGGVIIVFGVIVVREQSFCNNNVNTEIKRCFWSGFNVRDSFLRRKFAK